MSHELRATHPIDIAAEAASLALPSVQVVVNDEQPKTVWEETIGGIGVQVPRRPGELSQYLPFAVAWQRDPRRTHIERGLGGLGLIKAEGVHLHNLPEVQAMPYTAALLNYDQFLHSRSRLFATDGVIDSPDFQAKYPDADEVWSKQYSSTLKGLRDVFRSTTLFEVAEQMERDEPATVRQLRNKQKLPNSPKIELRTGHDGQLVVVQINAKQQVRSVA